jgi:hypothetical protein
MLSCLGVLQEIWICRQTFALQGMLNIVTVLQVLMSVNKPFYQQHKSGTNSNLAVLNVALENSL